MASDSLISVIGGLLRRENRLAREEKAKLKAAEAEEAEAEEDEEEDEDEDPVGASDPKYNPNNNRFAEQEPEDEEEPEPEADEPPPEAEPAPGEPEAEEEPNPEGDAKPTGPDPTLVAQVAAIVKKEIEDEAKEKKETEIKLSGKKEKIDTKPKMEQEFRKGKMNFQEAVRMAVTGTHLIEGYEQTVLDILEDEKIDGPLGYEPFFEKGKLYVEKGSERKAEKALKQAREVNKVPKIVGEELSEDEYLQMEAVAVDGRLKGFREALRRLTYEKIKAMKKEGIEVPEGMSQEGAAAFMSAASAAKKAGKKKFKIGGKEYPVTIKTNIPTKKEEFELDEEYQLHEDMFFEEYENLDEDGQLEIECMFELFENGELTEDEVIEGLADYLTKGGRLQKKADRVAAKTQKMKDKRSAKAAKLVKQRQLKKQIKTDKATQAKLKAKKKPGVIKRGLKAIGRGLKKVFGKSSTKKPAPSSSAPKPSSSAPKPSSSAPKPSSSAPKPSSSAPKPSSSSGSSSSAPPSKPKKKIDWMAGMDKEKIARASAERAKRRRAMQAAGFDPTLIEEIMETIFHTESQELQAIMALDDAGIKAEINRKGQVVIKKKDKKKAHKAFEKSFKKGGWPPLKLEDVDLEEASSKKARNKAADQIEAIADKGGAEAPTLFSLASKLRKGTHSTTGLKLSKEVTSILKDNGIKEEIKTRTAYEVVSEARNRASKNKPEWETEDSRLS